MMYLKDKMEQGRYDLHLKVKIQLNKVRIT